MLAGILMGLGASACWALANVAVARAGRDIGSIRALLWSLVTGTGMAALASPAINKHQLVLLPSLGGWLAAAGAASLVAYICMFYAFEHGRLDRGRADHVVVGGDLRRAVDAVFGERLGAMQLAGGAAVVAGALVVSRYAQAEGARGGTGGAALAVAAVGAAIGFGVLMPPMGRLVPVFGSIGAVGVVYVAVLVLGCRWRSCSGSGSPAARRRLAAGARRRVLRDRRVRLHHLGSRFAPLALVSPFASLASALTVAYAWAVLHERPPRPILVGAALVCAGVVVLAL